jgi:ubiquinone/menaquinone biosynthesis C-methylase UbiE
VETDAQSGQTYVLGNDADELARLDHQAAVIERPTRLLLQAAGLAPGMRVLDLGTGLGHVARLAGELVGPTGSVVGIDRSREALTVARQRSQQAGAAHVTFVEGDAVAWHAAAPFDAIVGRLFLFHVANPAAVALHHLRNLRHGGLFVAIDFDIGSARSEPAVAIADDAVRWTEEAFRTAGASPRVGARLGTILEGAGYERVSTFGIQSYLSSRDPSGAALLAGIVRSLAPAIVHHGIATEEQVDLETLHGRIADAVRQADAVVLPPTVVGAWGYASKAECE